MSPSFLGWDAAGWRAALPDAQPAPRSCLDAAAAWLLERFGTQMAEVIVAVPGGRAGRRLEELLVERATATAATSGAPALGLWPPAIVTAGALTDRLLLLDRPPATRLVRTLTWAEVLRATDRPTLLRIVASPPEPLDGPAWLALAEELRGLHGALGAEQHDFAAVAAAVTRVVPGAAGENERARWNALASVQAAYRRRLDELGLGDPHDLRRAAIDAGRLDLRRRVVLVGIAEMSGLLRAALDGLGERVEALVFAPPGRAADFDARGCVHSEPWAAAPVSLRPAAWRVADGPADQATAVVETLARWQSQHPVDSVTLGVPDTEVTPYLRARLAEQGVPVRDAQGLDLARTPTLRLLATLAALLERRRFSDLAAAVRHPQIEAWLASRPALDGVAAAQLLDEYQCAHLPDRVPSEWLGHPRAAAALGCVQAELDALLGELVAPGGGGTGGTGCEQRPLRLWAAPIAALLARVTGESRQLDRENDRDHALMATLEAVRDALLELAALPAALDASTRCGAGQALAVLESALAGRYVPPAEREPAVELLGWLELPLDEAPLILTGFNEGRVPQPMGGPGLLRDPLRRQLGMPDDRQRLARDVYSLCTIVASGRELLLLTGRRSAAGDPLLPSRLLFQCADEDVPGRLELWFPAEEDEAARAASFAHATPAGSTSQLPLPRRRPLVPTPPPLRLSVTAFKAYLQSPYRFYLDRVLGLTTVVEEHELSPQAFGTLAHDVLEDFGSDTATRDSTDATRIARILMQSLERRVALAYGDTALPAVAVQVEQLRRRLAGFADWQARRAREGWRIHAVEWEPPGRELAFEVDGEPIGLRGRIDRVDVHADGRWAVLDYKLSDRDVAGQDPGKNHRRKDGTWIDLQLPLYRLLVQPLAAERGWTRAPELGYVAMPRDPEQTGVLMAGWSEAELNEAWDQARDVVRAIRAGHFAELGDYPERDDEPVYAWIAGHGLLGESADDGDEGGEE